MKDISKYQGIIPAFYACYEDDGSVSPERTRKFTRYLIEKGVKGLPTQLGIEMAAEMIAKIKDEGLCDGVHIMAIGAEKNVPKILEKAGISID